MKWTCLSEVDKSMGRGDHTIFPPTVVWIAKYGAPNPYPQKFVYQACPFRLPNGRMCSKRGSKSVHFSPCTNHDEAPVCKFCFVLIMFDAIHGGTPPLHVNLLRCFLDDFSTWSEGQQLACLSEELSESISHPQNHRQGCHRAPLDNLGCPTHPAAIIKKGLQDS